MHTAGTSLAGIPANAAGHGELIEDVVEVALGRRRRPARERSSAVGPDRVAAFFCEPVIGAGGVSPPPPATCRPPARSAARPACCSSPTRSSPASAGRRVVRQRPLRSSSPTSSRARRASPAATCPWARWSPRRGSPSRSGPRAPACGATATPTAATPRPRPPRSPTSTSWSARACASAPWSSRRSWSTRSRPSPRIRW